MYRKTPTVSVAACCLSLGFASVLAASTPGAPFQVKDINTGYPNSSPVNLAVAGGRLFFTADDGATGAEPWTSDGTEAGTTLIKDINGAPGGSVYITAFSAGVNDVAYFAANDGSGGNHLWRSDGTTLGTFEVTPDIYLVNQVADIDGNLEVQGHPLGDALVHLYHSDGTGPGTISASSHVGAGGTFPGIFTSLNGHDYFYGADQLLTNGWELCTSDGTSGGTFQVKDIYPGAGSSGPSSLAACNNWVLFFADENDGFGSTLHHSDGTGAGTAEISTIRSVRGFAQIACTGTLALVIANDGTHGAELWKTDGTPGGTSMVKDVRPGSVGGLAESFLTEMGSKVFFAADDGVHGLELWCSDGTEAGTVMVKDINAGPVSSSPIQMAVINNLLFFSAYGGIAGVQPWVSDGTTDGTYKLGDVFYGANSFASEFTYAGDYVFFSATDGVHGQELWALSLPAEEGTGLPGGDDPPPAGLLAQNLPNPFTGSTEIMYRLPTDGPVRLRLYDAGGREVRTLVDGVQAAGDHVVRLPATGLPAGIYFYRLEAGSIVEERKAILVR